MNNIGKQAALYSRIASKGHGVCEYIKRQQKTLRTFALEQGYEDYKEYSDIGYSGNDFARPSMKDLWGDITAGKINVVVVRDMSRISRNLVQLEQWVKETEGYGVKLITLDGSHRIRFTTDDFLKLMKARKKLNIDCSQ